MRARNILKHFQTKKNLIPNKHQPLDTDRNQNIENKSKDIVINKCSTSSSDSKATPLALHTHSGAYFEQKVHLSNCYGNFLTTEIWSRFGPNLKLTPP